MIGINKVACLMASYNRKNKTLNTLESLYSQSDIDSLALDIFLVDDASNDGTASTVRKIYPDVTVYETTGDKYWSGAMREGMSYLIGKEYDFFLWMNDDVNLDKDAIAKIYKR